MAIIRVGRKRTSLYSKEGHDVIGASRTRSIRVLPLSSRLLVTHVISKRPGLSHSIEWRIYLNRKP